VSAKLVPLPPGVEPVEHMFAAKVDGNCMTGDHIRDGDIVLFDQDKVPSDGDICAVWITLDGIRGWMLKRVRLRGPDLHRLEPSNPGYKAIALTREHHAKVAGVAVGVIRVVT
jgi:SOS-response transcriptional repressor LexA